MPSIERALLRIAVGVIAVGLTVGSTPPAHASESTASTQVDPALESVSDTSAFIRWVTANPGGTILHYAVVQYGTHPDNLDLTAKSPTRINPTHSDMIFRVRVNDLEPGTTYYYRVSSQQANGASDPATSAVNIFTTLTSSETVSNK